MCMKTDFLYSTDFYATKDGKSYLVQVAYSIADEDTYNREFALFNKLDQSMRKIIIKGCVRSPFLRRRAPFRAF